MAPRPEHHTWETIMYLESILSNIRSANEIADARANMLMVISGVVLSFSFTPLLSADGLHRIAFAVISLVAFFTIFMTIGVIRPKIGHSKTNTMYHLGIVKFSRDAYERELNKAVGNFESIVGEYAEEIYDFSLEMRARYKMIRTAADVLATGLAIGLLLLFVT